MTHCRSPRPRDGSLAVGSLSWVISPYPYTECLGLGLHNTNKKTGKSEHLNQCAMTISPRRFEVSTMNLTCLVQFFTHLFTCQSRPRALGVSTGESVVLRTVSGIHDRGGSKKARSVASWRPQTPHSITIDFACFPLDCHPRPFSRYRPPAR